MIIADPGHYYFLDTLDGGKAQVLIFVKREGEGYPGNVGHYPGANVQEVLRACIDRLKYLDNQIPSEYTKGCIELLKETVYNLELRAAGRHHRVVTFDINGAVYGDTCKKCGHVGCGGECHA